jgi:hypothetical protein
MKLIDFKNTSRAISVVASILCVGGILSFYKASDSNSKALALNIIIGSSAIAVGNHLASKWYEDTANSQAKTIVNGYEITVKNVNSELKNLTDKHRSQSKTLDEIKSLATAQEKSIAAKDTTIRLLQSELLQVTKNFDIKTKELQMKLDEDDNRFNELLKAFKSQLAEDISDRIYLVYNGLQESIDIKLANDKYQSIHSQLEKFAVTLAESYENHCSMLQAVPTSMGSWESILKSAIDIYSQISHEITALKVKYRNVLNIDIRLNLEQAYETLADCTPKTKATGILREFSESSKSDLKNLQSKIIDNQNSLEEMRGQVSDLLDEIDHKNLEISDLKLQVSDLKKPLIWTNANSRELQIGNAIVQYFWQAGLYLDRAYAEGDIYDVDICFQIDRNSRFIKESELNEHSEALQQWCRTIKPVTFKWDSGKALMVAKVVLKEREKVPTSIEEIRRMIEPAARFGDIVRRYHDHTQDGKPTLRVMTRTGGGKGVAVKNILHNYVNNLEGWELWLSDPQHGSTQDFWNVPKVAKSPEQASDTLETFISEFMDRKNGRSLHPNVPVIGVFDETDKTFTKPEKQGIAQIWTEIRHRDMKLILIGQSGEVGKNGWTWDEMNNCSMLFIGEAIGTAIKHADDMGWSSDMCDSIPTVYRVVSDWMNEANRSIPAKNKYRLGLLINGLRYTFVEIPPAIDGSFENQKSWLVNKPWESINTQSVPFNNNLMPTLKESTNTVLSEQIKCIHCQSQSFRRHSSVKAKNQYRYQCNDCKKTFTALDNKIN